MSDHLPSSDGRLNMDKAAAREWMYCVVRPQEDKKKPEQAKRMRRKRNRMSCGLVEGKRTPGRFSKRQAVLAKAVR